MGGLAAGSAPARQEIRQCLRGSGYRWYRNRGTCWRTRMLSSSIAEISEQLDLEDGGGKIHLQMPLKLSPLQITEADNFLPVDPSCTISHKRMKSL